MPFDLECHQDSVGLGATGSSTLFCSGRTKNQKSMSWTFFRTNASCRKHHKQGITKNTALIATQPTRRVGCAHQSITQSRPRAHAQQPNTRTNQNNLTDETKPVYMALESYPLVCQHPLTLWCVTYPVQCAATDPISPLRAYKTHRGQRTAHAYVVGGMGE